MIELCKLIWCGLIGLFRSRASLEIEILALRHQLNILRRKSLRRPILGSIDRMVFVGLYGLAPDVLSALAIVRPETGPRKRRGILARRLAAVLGPISQQSLINALRWSERWSVLRR